jgi:hypothetical protein
MPYRFTRHARNRLRRTTLDEATLVRMLENPAAEDRAGKRMNRWLAWKNDWIRVVLVEEQADVIVITVIWPARPPRTTS